MVSLAILWVERLGLFVRRFILEVLASAIVTACVAAATTTYLRYADTPAPRPVASIPVGNLLSPIPDAGATHFLVPAATAAPASGSVTVTGSVPATVQAQVRPVALPPPRPRIAAAPAKVLPTRPELAQAVPVAEPAAPDDPVPVLMQLDSGTPDRPADPAPPAAVPPPAAKPEQTILGVAVPDIIPRGSDVVKRVRGLGEAVGSLMP
ncbi:hypothetical protein [Labrys wisconsinensis]|uniref:Uncharacterized protein n=1 Tax=Labrys wisconsinensis TaxID=425677 RepID=A0ABU0JMF5_9HYPH|nr:hypothetical protein [Labrys wisconsinensis]MDQ0474449.1 hypothetical protein [Labrys wisconsinensis]